MLIENYYSKLMVALSMDQNLLSFQIYTCTKWNLMLDFLERLCFIKAILKIHVLAERKAPDTSYSMNLILIIKILN